MTVTLKFLYPMKKLFLICGLVMFSFVAVKAQDVAKDNKNAPQITFTKLVHDYGTIYQEGDGNCEFEFKNTGKEPLVLTTVTSSCGCTIPEWPKKPILPGKTDVIKVKYDTKRIGKIAKQVTVNSNAKNTPVVLKIEGNVIEKPNANIPEKKTNDGATPVAK